MRQSIDTNSWASFVESLNVALEAGVDAKRIAESVSGKSVCWSGIIDSKINSRIAPRVKIRMKEAFIRVAPTGKANYAVLTISTRGFESTWVKVHEGDEIKFEASFVAASSPFPAFEIEEFPSGAVTVEFRLEGAKHISNRENKK